MHPLLFEFGGFTLYSYGLMVALAFIVGTLWVIRRARQVGESDERYLEAIFWIMVAGFTGARLMYVLYYPEYYLADPWRILLDRGGLVWYGGLISAVMASLVFVRVKRLSLPKFGDILITPVALGLAIGRVGCFLTGCCYGKPTDAVWGVQFPHGHETFPAHVHPTQLYETFALLILLGLMQWVYKHSKVSGATMCLFFVGYGVIRFIIEHFRGDGIYWVGHLLTASQTMSLAGIIGGVLVYAVLKARTSKATGPLGASVVSSPVLPL